MSRHVAKKATLGAAPRIPDPQIDLPAQGSRPAHLGDPAADRPGQGCAGGDPGRRVRRRPPGPHAQRTVRPDHARAGAGRPLRRLRGRRPGHLPRLGQHDVPLRAEPQAPRGHRRASGDLRDDVLPAEPAVRQRFPAPRIRGRCDRVLRRARRGGRRPRTDRGQGSRRRARGGGTGPFPGRPVRRDGGAGHRRPRSPRTSWGHGTTAGPRCARLSPPRSDPDPGHQPQTGSIDEPEPARTRQRRTPLSSAPTGRSWSAATSRSSRRPGNPCRGSAKQSPCAAAARPRSNPTATAPTN